MKMLLHWLHVNYSNVVHHAVGEQIQCNVVGKSSLKNYLQNPSILLIEIWKKFSFRGSKSAKIPYIFVPF